MIHNIMNVLGRPQGPNPENFMSTSLFFAEICEIKHNKFCADISIRSVSGRGVKKGDTWRKFWVHDRRHGGHGHS